VLEGGCFCGRIRFAVGEVFDCVYCHCSECRRTHGAALPLFVVVEADKFTLSGDPPAAFRRAHGHHCFCPTCGTNLSYRGDGSAYVSISHGAFDRAEDIRPLAHQFWPLRLPWLDLHDDLPKFEGNTLSHPATRRR